MLVRRWRLCPDRGYSLSQTLDLVYNRLPCSPAPPPPRACTSNPPVRFVNTGPSLTTVAVTNSTDVAVGLSGFATMILGLRSGTKLSFFLRFPRRHTEAALERRALASHPARVFEGHGPYRSAAATQSTLPETSSQKCTHICAGCASSSLLIYSPLNAWSYRRMTLTAVTSSRMATLPTHLPRELRKCIWRISSSWIHPWSGHSVTKVGPTLSSSRTLPSTPVRLRFWCRDDLPGSSTMSSGRADPSYPRSCGFPGARATGVATSNRRNSTYPCSSST
jgi:hypothetical protein